MPELQWTIAIRHLQKLRNRAPEAPEAPRGANIIVLHQSCAHLEHGANLLNRQKRRESGEQGADPPQLRE